MGQQTSYGYTQGVAIAGMIADLGAARIDSMRNAEASAVPFGVGVVRYAEKSVKLPASATADFAGVIIHHHARNQWGMSVESSDKSAEPAAATMAVMSEGRVYVAPEQAVAFGDPVYMRITANGAGKLQLGAFRKDSDSGNAILLKSARWYTGCDANGVAQLEVQVHAVRAEKANLDRVTLTPGAEATNAIDVVGAIVDAAGNAITGARQVKVTSLGVTDTKGDLGAATAAVGTIKKTNNPATGENVQWMETTAAGLFSFKVSNDVAEETLVTVEAEGCLPKTVKLTFA